MFVMHRARAMESKQLDDLDREILKELRLDCRRSYRELARALKMSPAALIERMKKLEKSGIVKSYVASLDMLKLGYEFMGVVQIALEPGYLLESQQKISRLRGVYAVYDVTGEYDSVAFIIARSRSEFSALVKKILGTPHVKRTNTNMVLNVVKDPFAFNEI
jgi:DNA-binding Lrp family transcriptional regulator